MILIMVYSLQLYSKCLLYTLKMEYCKGAKWNHFQTAWLQFQENLHNQ